MSQKAALLAAVRDELKQRLAAIGGRAFVVVEPPQAGPLLPAEAQTPFATVADGGVEFTPLAGRIADAAYRVIVRVYVQNLRDAESPVLGNAAGSEAGVAALQDAILAVLQYNTLTARIAGIEQALPLRAGPVEYGGDETWFAVFGDVVMSYRAEE